MVNKVFALILILALVMTAFSFGPARSAEAGIDDLETIFNNLITVINGLTADERQELSKLKGDLLTANTIEQILDFLADKGLKDNVDDAIDTSVDVAWTKTLLELMIPSTGETWDDIKNRIQELINNYSTIVAKLKNRGVTSEEIYSFIIEINSRLNNLKNSGSITTNNYETELVKTVQSLLRDEQTTKYPAIRRVIVEAYERSPFDNVIKPEEMFNTANAPLIVALINTKVENLSNDLVVIKDTFDLARKIFKDMYLSTQTGGGSSGGGGGDSSSASASEITVSVNANNENKITIPGTSFTLVIPAQAFDLPAGAEAKVRVQELTGEKAQQLFNDVINSEQRNSYNLYGKIYDLEILITKDGTTTKVTSFKKPVRVELPYDEITNPANQEKMAVWKFDDAGKQFIFMGGKADKDKKVVIVFLNTFSKYGVMVYNKTFDDMKTHWAKADVEILASRLIVKGVTDKQFGPELNVTRAQFAALLVRALGLKEEAAITFKDVQSGNWFYSEVAKAVKTGIVKGYDDGKFRPDQKITREEMAVMIERILGVNGKGQALNSDDAKLLEKFNDKTEISSWAKDSVTKILKVEMFKGRSKSVLAPRAATTRAEAAVIVKRVLGQI